jgi:hypothetical protein
VARGVRFTKAERDFLRAWLEADDWDVTRFGGVKGKRAASSILAKLSASEERPTGVDVSPLEEALVASARGKVIPLEGGYGMAGGMATSMKATPEQARLVGEWMARQGWLTGPMTLIDVLKKWYQWLPKARATQPPPALTPGLGKHADDGRGPAAAGPAAAGGRPAPGFGRAAPKPRADGVSGD